MEASVRMCVSCHKIDQGHSEWETLAGQSPCKTRKSLCPDCCRSRFPQYYEDLGPPVKANRGVSAILASITKMIKT